MARKKWSFSKISTWHQCQLQFKLIYEDKVKQGTNGYARFGSLMHDSIEMILKGEDGEANYRSKMHGIPLPSDKKYIPYLVTIPTFLRRFKDWKIKGEIIGIEQRRSTILDDENSLTTISDLEIRNENGGIDIIDWKISNPFTPSQMKEKKRQLYIYAHAVKDTYGEFPENMYFYFPAKQGNKKYVKIEFDENDYNDTMKWLMDSIKATESEGREANPQWYFCNNLCGVAHECPAAANF